MQVWPSLKEAASTVDRFRSMPEMDQCRKKMDAAGYVRERIAKAKELLSRAERENAQRETTLRVHEAMVGRRQNLDGLTAEQLVGVGWTTENLIKKIKDWIVYRGGQPTGVNADPLPPSPRWRLRTCRRDGSWRRSTPRRTVVGAAGMVVSVPAQT
jgi:hypothetical protein